MLLCLCLKSIYSRLDTLGSLYPDIFSNVKFFVIDDSPYSGKEKDYRIPPCVINGIAYNNNYFYPSYSGMILPEGFEELLHTHGYRPIPIQVENLLRTGGGLACSTWK